MKRIIFASIVTSFVCGLAAQAGEDCDKTKAACADKAKAGCETAACCAKQAKPKGVVKKAPEKGAMLLVRR